MIQLPFFRYHPDPVSTGSVEESSNVCLVCNQARGFIYTGPAYSEEEDFDSSICPWCIFDGSAHRILHVEFTNPEGIGGYGDWDSVDSAVIEEVAYRTPGFETWQDPRWFTHCHDAGQFLGPAGRTELDKFGIEAIKAIQHQSGYQGDEWNYFHLMLDRDHGPTAYLFRCRHCEHVGGYSDIH